MTFSLQTKNGYYHAVYRTTDQNGRTVQKWVTTGIKAARGNKKEAMRVAEKIVSERKENESATQNAESDLQLWKWIEMWLDQKAFEVEQNTYEGYICYFKNHIEPYFKAHPVKLCDLTPQCVQLYYNSKARKPGDKQKGKLSGKSLHDHHVVIHGALEDAVRKNLIPYNYADRVTLPKKERYTGSFYTKEQVAALIDAAAQTPLKYLVPFTLFYGLRRSEVLGLKWDAIDFANRRFTIQSTVVKFKTQIEKETTKNKASHRTYPMPEGIVNLLLDIKQQQGYMRVKYGNAYIDGNYVFTWDDGRLLSPDYVTRKFSKILSENGLPHIRFHDLRHTTASLLLNAGYDLKHISEWLGHSDIGTTMNIYAHLSMTGKAETSEVMTQIVLPPAP